LQFSRLMTVTEDGNPNTLANERPTTYSHYGVFFPDAYSTLKSCADVTPHRAARQLRQSKTKFARQQCRGT
jgi:hypothetical protein